MRIGRVTPEFSCDLTQDSQFIEHLLESLPYHLLLGIIKQLGIREHIDAEITLQGNWQGASVGTVVSLWLCYLLSRGDHRLVAVRDWVAARETLFNESLRIALRATDWQRS